MVDSYKICTSFGIIYTNITMIKNLINCDGFIDSIRYIMEKSTGKTMIGLVVRISTMKIVIAKDFV